MSNFEFLCKHYGLTLEAWASLVRIQKRLHKCGEDHCNGLIQFDDDDNTWYWYRAGRYGSPTIRSHEMRNPPEAMERKAQEIAEPFGLHVYHQEDPRGCALYIYDPEELSRLIAKHSHQSWYGIDCCYSMIGTALA